MWRGGGGLVLVACVLTAAAGGPTRLLTSSLVPLTSVKNGNTTTTTTTSGRQHHNHTRDGSDPREGGHTSPHQRDDGLGRLSDQDDSLRTAHELLLSRLLRSAEALNTAAANGTEGGESRESQGVTNVDKWQCLVEWMRAHNRQVSKKGEGTCEKEGGESVAVERREKMLDECVPVLFLVIPSLCNGTNSCINVTEASLESFLHRYWVWERKRKRREESTDAVIYIVVVLAFYSFGIVFMMANFVRQEQRELEETKLYKQYVKLARDRWLTSRGSLANRLALQALNTLNAVPQTTDVNKVTFV
ncbi:uncharacterized protein [Panulirus ornatus]|uniref:uncharacterized protein n=1 Tax=Panulirus ornatus TaxID=150431 RepID=UPI003A88F413